MHHNRLHKHTNSLGVRKAVEPKSRGVTCIHPTICFFPYVEQYGARDNWVELITGIEKLAGEILTFRKIQVFVGDHTPEETYLAYRQDSWDELSGDGLALFDEELVLQRASRSTHPGYLKI